MSPPGAPPPNYNPPGYAQQPPPGYAPQGYPGYGPMPMAPPPPKTNVTVIIVVAVVVVLAVIIIVPALLYVSVSNMGPPQQPIPPTMVLQGSGSWAVGSTSATYTFTVATVTPTSANVNPTQLQYIVSNAQETPLYSGAANQNTSSGGFTINVVYQDSLDVGRVSAGDRVQIIVSPNANNPLVGGNIQVNFNGASFATGRM